MIRVEDLVFRYGDGDFALEVQRLGIESGETVAVVGPSGSGKTTLLNLIAGITVPERGQVQAGDVPISALDDGARRAHRIAHIGLVFQEFELLEYLTVLDNVLLPYRVNPALRLEGGVRDRARALARDVGIGDKLKRHVDRLSHGERQRVAVCRALVTGPQLLLADEPTGNLDPANRDRVLEMLFDYAAREAATLLVVTHDHELLRRFDRVIDMASLQRQSSA